MDELTIYDIAEKAGVSASTVSRVINNYPHVKKATRAKVQKLLSEYNFIPNETARNLVTQSSRMIGVLISDITTTQYTDGVFFMEQEFSSRGYTCLICNTGPDSEKQAAQIHQLSTKKIDAMVLIGSIFQNDKVKEAIDKYVPNIPVAICNGYLDNENVYGIVQDEKEGVSNCVKLLLSKGRKNIAFIYNHITPSNQKKLDGYVTAIAEKTGKEPLAIMSSTTIDKVSAITKELVTNHPEVDGIIYSEDFMAMTGLHALNDLGKKVPQDISVIGINNSRFADICIPPLTSLDNKLYESSLASVRNILQVLNGEQALKKVIICSEIVERSST